MSLCKHTNVCSCTIRLAIFNHSDCLHCSTWWWSSGMHSFIPPTSKLPEVEGLDERVAPQLLFAHTLYTRESLLEGTFLSYNYLFLYIF